MSADELVALDAVTLASLVRRRKVSPVETVAAAAAAFERLDPFLHAFCTPAIEQALAAARHLENHIIRGEDVGPLCGVPVGIKDLVLTKGIRTTFGSQLYSD